METEISSELKEEADRIAIDIFAGNLRQLLLAPPLKGQRILALDPGYRTGCKVVALDAQGNLLDDTVIYAAPPRSDLEGASRILRRLIERHKLQVIALGNGTASRETERFLKDYKIIDSSRLFIVSENGASVYSASDVARKEFPDKDVTVRGAVSIGRRLIDPLAELVKIDPKSIGVGQYQHDVDQGKLKDSLDFVVTSCVNSVGVDVNTASERLLSYVSGIGPALAANIVTYRRDNGDFATRQELKKCRDWATRHLSWQPDSCVCLAGKSLLTTQAFIPKAITSSRRWLNASESRWQTCRQIRSSSIKST